MAEYATGGYFHTESTAARPILSGVRWGLIKKDRTGARLPWKQDGKFKIRSCGNCHPSQ